MGCALWLALGDKLHWPPGQGLLHTLGLGGHHDEHPFESKPQAEVDRVVHQRSTEERMEYLCSPGPHPGSLASG